MTGRILFFVESGLSFLRYTFLPFADGYKCDCCSPIVSSFVCGFHWLNY